MKRRYARAVPKPPSRLPGADALAEHYTAIAKTYDTLYTGRLERTEDDVVRLLARSIVKPGARVLDVGCGTGHLIPMLYGLKVRYLGLDPAQGMIDILRERYQGADARPCRFEEADFLGWNETEAVMALYGAWSYVQPERGLRKLVEILRPGGQALLMTYGPRYRVRSHQGLSGGIVTFRPSPATMIAMSSRWGLRVVDCCALTVTRAALTLPLARLELRLLGHRPGACRRARYLVTVVRKP